MLHLLDDPKYWLTKARHFNRLWHECDDHLRSIQDTLSEHERHYQEQYCLLLRNQKQDCQLTALRLAVLSETTDIILELDHHEKGVHGDGVFYSLYPKDDFYTGCHIPKHALEEYLTPKQLAFFNIK